MQLPNPRNGTNETHKSDLVAGNGPAAAHNCTFARHMYNGCYARGPIITVVFWSFTVPI